MKLLPEQHVNDNPALLDQAWSTPETFAFIPAKAAVDTAWLNAALESLPAPLRRDHFAMLTSGSTGRPKLIIGVRERSENLARVLHDVQRGEPVAQAIVALPLTYTYAFVNQWLWAKYHNRQLVLTPGIAQPDRLQMSLEAARDAMICLVGMQVPLLAQHFAERSFPGVIRVHFAGGRFPQEQLGVIRSLFPNAQVFNNFGCAEAMPRLTIRRAEDATEAANIGRPLPGIELSTSPEEALLFRSPYGAVGYVDDGGFVPIEPGQWVPTGDLGRRNEDGTWRITGRGSEVFKRYGEKVALPTLLATVLGTWTHAAVFYRERDAAGEEGHVLVLSPGATDDEVRKILKSFRLSHPRAQWPLRVESVENMPLLPSGKVDTASLATLSGKTVHWYQRV